MKSKGIQIWYRSCNFAQRYFDQAAQPAGSIAFTSQQHSEPFILRDVFGWVSVSFFPWSFVFVDEWLELSSMYQNLVVFPPNITAHNIHIQCF